MPLGNHGVLHKGWAEDFDLAKRVAVALIGNKTWFDEQWKEAHAKGRDPDDAMDYVGGMAAYAAFGFANAFVPTCYEIGECEYSDVPKDETEPPAAP